MIIVTGGAGFIGSNLIKSLNDGGRTDILIVDNLTKADKCRNLSVLKALDFYDKNQFMDALKHGVFNYEDIDVIFHQGACSDTMETDGKYIMENNYDYSKKLLHFCLERKISFVYASSASTYGSGKKGFTERLECEQALNAYAYSKLFFDRYVQRLLPNAHSQVVGLRYFNVFGPQEHHKGKMASMVYQMYRQIKQTSKIKLFKGYGCPDGQQKRDFIYVKDVVEVNKFFFENSNISGIFNCGTGKEHSFKELADEVIDFLNQGEIEYIDFPTQLIGKYQNFTQADTKKLLDAGYNKGFTRLDKAVAEYCNMLESTDGYFE